MNVRVRKHVHVHVNMYMYMPLHIKKGRPLSGLPDEHILCRWSIVLCTMVRSSININIRAYYTYPIVCTTLPSVSLI
ncbi:hypothetical protein D3C74_164670 [compost metagenome]